MAMTLRELCELGTAELGEMALRGELQPSHLWVAMSGAADYRRAVAKGDVVEQDEGDVRLVECMTCPSRQERPSERARGVVSLWCGQPFEERPDTALPTCGCLVGITVDGAPHAGGLTMVKSKTCPQGRW